MGAEQRCWLVIGDARGAKAISYWLKDPSPLLRNLVEAKNAKWFIAYQGESDALRRSTTWAADFAQLVGLARAATNPQLRVLVIGLADQPSIVGRNLWNNLREQQRAYVAGDPLPRYVTAQGLKPREDEVHLTRAGYATPRCARRGGPPLGRCRLERRVFRGQVM